MTIPSMFRSGIVLASLCFFTLQADAAYVWLDKSASGDATASYGELNGKKESTSSLTAARAFLSDGRDLGLTIKGDATSIATPIDDRDMRFTARAIGEKDSIQFFHARFGRNETKAMNDLELVPTEANGSTFKLYWKGSVVTAAQVKVVTSDGWTKMLTADADGSMKLPMAGSGLYVLSAEIKINGTVTVDGKQYSDVRHTATLSFKVDSNCK